MEQIISKKEFDDLMKLEGKVRGMAIIENTEFILKEEGREGLKKLEEIITKLGYPLKYKEIKKMDYYPLGLGAINLLAIKRLFNYDDKKFQEMGEIGSKISVIIRFFMKHLISLDRMIKVVSRMWKTYYSTGELQVIEVNKEKRYIILRLKDFRHTPMLCQNLIGYLPSILHIVTKTKTSCQETKCIHRGDEYHEYLLRW